MIIGVGSDLIDIRRVEKTLKRFPERFKNRIFTETERRKSDRRANRAASYAKRFAAKEACSKALGTGFRRGVFWRDLGVVNLKSGKPTMALTGGARARLESLIPEGMAPQIDLTITDDFPLAQAVVIISAVPKDFPRLQSRPMTLRVMGWRACPGDTSRLRARLGVVPRSLCACRMGLDCVGLTNSGPATTLSQLLDRETVAGQPGDCANGI